MPQPKKVIVIVGPTAVGKTALAIQLAQHFKTDIVSADSRQFYRELEKATAKPTLEELGLIQHYGINSHSIENYYSVGQYEHDALAWIKDIHQKADYALLVGGSGLYAKAVTEGLDEMPEIDFKIRQSLQERLVDEGLIHLLLELQRLDPEHYRQIDKANPQRVLRALEVCLSVGQPYSSFRTGKAKVRPFDLIKIGITMPREKLYARIEARMEAMLADGLLEEARALFPQAHLPALQTVGYQEIFGYLRNEYDWQETHRLLMRNSRRYAKRQFTWFQRDTQINWFEATQITDILAHIAKL